MVWKGWERFDPNASAARQVRSKYGAEPITVDGLRFDSKLEAGSWMLLKARETVGEIQGLRRQVAFALDTVDPQGLRRQVAGYVADFVYLEQGIMRVADAKGFRGNPLWRLKKRWFEAQYGITIQEA